VLWPLANVLVLAIRRRTKRVTDVRIIGLALTVLTLASFIVSAVGVAADSGADYFATTGRAWEFGADGLLAFAAVRFPPATVEARMAVSWFGLAAIAATSALYSDTTPFPGPAPLLAVVGTLAVICAGTPHAWLPPSVLLPSPPPAGGGYLAITILQSDACKLAFAVNVLTNPEAAQADIGLGVLPDDRCKQTFSDATVIECSIGDTSSPETTIAVVGDSHAGHYFEALF
jgi:hypothetical protein